MQAPATTPTRERWLEILSRCHAGSPPEYRRKDPRRNVQFGRVRLAYRCGPLPMVRRGTVLNASASGVMIRQQEEIAAGTTVLMEVNLGHEALTLAGQVVHSTPTVGGFKVGIELQFPDPLG